MNFNKTAIEIVALNKWFDDFKVLNNINLRVDVGEIVVVCGPSGSGKSTLVRCINCLERHDSGELKVLGNKIVNDKNSLKLVSSQVGMVFQQFNLFPHLSVIENLTLGPIQALGLSRDEALSRAQKLLDRL